MPRGTLVAYVALALMTASLLLAAPMALADTLTVTTLSDENDGGGAGSGMSLRDAIAEAVDGDTINFDPALTSGGPATATISIADLLISKSLTITGPGADQLTLSGGDARRLFQVIADVDLTLSGLTLADGLAKGGNGGNGSGGGGGGMGAGGALYIYDGNVTAANIIFESNSATGGNGGNSSENVTFGGGGGGGVGDGASANGVSSSSSSGGVGGPSSTGTPGSGGGLDQAGGSGGPGAGGGGAGATSGIPPAVGGAGGFGGGGGASGGASTQPARSGGAGGFGAGGGGCGFNNSPATVIGGAAGQFAGIGAGTASTGGGGGGGGAGLGGAVFVNDTATFTATACGFIGNSATGGLPGASQANPLGAGSGLGKGGAIFVRTGGVVSLTSAEFLGNTAADSAKQPDDNPIFYGVVGLDAFGFVVDNIANDADQNPGDGVAETAGGETTLRAAIEEANGLGIPVNITFDPTLFAGGEVTIPVASSELLINSDITITGPDEANLTISGQSTRRIFQVISGSLQLLNLTLADGNARGGTGGSGSGGGGGGMGAGGAIYIYDGDVTATNVRFADNRARGGTGGSGLFDQGSGGGGGGVGNGVTANGGAPSGNTGGAGAPSVLSPGGAGGFQPANHPGSPGGPGAGGGGGANSDFGFGTGGAGGFGGGGGGAGDAGSSSTAGCPGGDGGFGGGGGGSGWHILDFPGIGGDAGEFAGAGGSSPSINTDNGGGGGGAGLGGAVFVNDTASFTGNKCVFEGNTAVGGLPGANRGAGTVPGTGQGKGGALFVRSGGAATLVNPRFSPGNTAADDTGTVGDNDRYFGSVTFQFTEPLAVVVNTLNDSIEVNPGDGFVEDSTGKVSLRAALEEASALNVGADISFDPELFSGGTQSLELTLSSLTVTTDVVITGPGADLLQISGGNNWQIFFVQFGSLELHDATLRNGAGGNGGAIETLENLTLQNCVVQDCSASGSGGAIHSGTDNVTNLTNVQILRCSALVGSGGALWQSGGTLTLSGCTVADSSALLDGGAIYQFDGVLALLDSVIHDCATEESGGALGVSLTQIRMANTTLSGNSANEFGGAMDAFAGNVAIANCTITGNRADADDNGTGSTGGVRAMSGTITLHNSIVAGNTTHADGSSFANSFPDIEVNSGLTSSHNIIGNPDTVVLDPSDINLSLEPPDTLATIIDGLADNGGPVVTHALLSGGLAVNAGSNALALNPFTSTPLTTDQRGPGFPRIEGDTVDIGAFELTADTDPPGVTVEQAIGQADPVNVLPIVYLVSLSEQVDELVEADFTFDGPSVSAVQITQDSPISYTVSVTGLGGDGTLSLSIAAGALQDEFGNGNTQSTSTDNTITYDTTPPEVTPNGASPLTLECGTAYTELGATALDAIEGDLSGAVQTSGTVDHTQAGNSDIITYQVTDAAGNTGNASRVVNVADSIAPLLILNGAPLVQLGCGGTYTEAGATATDACDDNVDANVEIDSSALNLNAAGSYQIIYSVQDATGNAANPLTRTVEVVDSNPPTLTLLGSSSLTLRCGSTFDDPGVIATDSCDGDLAGAVELSGAVDTATLGEYTLTYAVSDAAGNEAQSVTRTITVIDDVAPVLSVNGPDTVQINCLEEYIELGATAVDACDGDLTGAVEIGGDVVDITRSGVYVVTYDVRDSGDNVSTQRTRTVTVINDCVIGDVDGDGVTSPADAQQAFNMFLFLTGTDIQKRIADICGDFPNGDDSVDPADAQGIFNLFLEIEPACN